MRHSLVYIISVVFALFFTGRFCLESLYGTVGKKPLRTSHSGVPSSAACPPPGKQPFARVELEIPQDLTLLFTLPGIPIHPNLS